jgi:hypothetical protein
MMIPAGLELAISVAVERLLSMASQITAEEYQEPSYPPVHVFVVFHGVLESMSGMVNSSGFDANT